MTDDFDPAAMSADELAAKIQHLEQGLARLKGEVYARNLPTEFPAPLLSTELATQSSKQLFNTLSTELCAELPAELPPESSEKLSAKLSGKLFANDETNWLLDIIKHLFTEHNSASINYTLEQVGTRLELDEASVWYWESSGQHKCFGTWNSGRLPHIQNENGQLSLIAGEEPLAQLMRGDTVTFSASQDPGLPLDTSDITLIPIQRNHNTEGFIALQSREDSSLSPVIADQIKLLGDLLFSVHDRQRMLRTLADRDTRFQYAMEASRDGLWDWNIETGQIYFSRSYLRMLGYTYESLPGNLDTLRDYFLHPDDAERVLTQYQAAVDNKRPHMNLEFRMLHRDGHELWIYARAKFVEQDANGRPRRCVGINADITDFIRSQEELLSAKTQADIANKTKSEFLARMSHEIRTPMNAIIGLGHLLSDTRLDEQQGSYLGSMTTAAESLLHIINQVLDFSKIETGKIMLENSHFDLDQVFEKLSRLFEISALHKAIDIIYDIKSDVPRFLRGDAPRLSHIISHLITNALQYSTSTQIVVGISTLSQNSQHVTLEFTITDFGVGMSHEQLTQLQNSLHKNTVNTEGDTGGFGLSICNHLVGLMNGRIHINSNSGRGCRISFTARFEHSHIGAKSLHDQPHALSNFRALIVDDNTIARNIIASTAHSISLHAETTDSADNALKKIREADESDKPYHLVLMDYKMPGIDGLQAARLIKSDSSLGNAPLVFLISAYRQDEIVDTDNNVVFVDGFLNKPVSESRLFDTIHQVIDASHPLYKLMSHSDTNNEDDNALLKNLRVLLAEDNVVNQQVASGILRKKGITVTIANHGREAIDLLHRHSDAYDIILMDLEMPELDGYQATHQIRTGSVCSGVPIIAVTAQAMRGDRERCLAAGMDAYLTKPIIPDLLYRTLADTLRAQATEK
jgi:two-component system sensor histidine kinase/response regulator